MFNPPETNPDPGSYVDLLNRTSKALQKARVDEQMLELLKQAFEQELSARKIVLARAEKTRLFRQVSRSLLTGLLEKIESEK